MNKLIIVRHGSYGESDLNDRGREEMAQLAKKLGRVVGDRPAKILASTAPRAEQSAEILARYLCVPMETHEILFSAPDHEVRLPEVMDLIERNGEAEIIILVTHLEYIEFLPPIIGERIGAKDFPCSELSRGDAYVIDYEERTCERAVFM